MNQPPVSKELTRKRWAIVGIELFLFTVAVALFGVHRGFGVGFSVSSGIACGYVSYRFGLWRYRRMTQEIAIERGPDRAWALASSIFAVFIRRGIFLILWLEICKGFDDAAASRVYGEIFAIIDFIADSLEACLVFVKEHLTRETLNLDDFDRPTN